MKKAPQLALLVLFLSVVAARPALAQGGCDDSPENPTLILAALAGGVYGANTLRMRLRAARAPKSNSSANL